MRVLAVLALGVAACGGVSACSCLPYPVPNCESEYALVATAGPVKDVTCPKPDGVSSFAARFLRSVRLIEFNVTEVLEQPNDASIAAGTIIQISTAPSSASCGVNTQEGTSYLLYPSKLERASCDAAKTKDSLSLSLCAGHVSNPSAKNIALYKDECLPEPEPEPPTCEEQCQSRCEARCERRCFRG